MKVLTSGVLPQASPIFRKTIPKFLITDLIIVDWLTQFSEIKDATYVRGFLGRMLFPGEDGVKKMRVLSGGEKVRVLFSRMMIEASNVLILDEPTDHLDMESITALNNGLINSRVYCSSLPAITRLYRQPQTASLNLCQTALSLTRSPHTMNIWKVMKWQENVLYIQWHLRMKKITKSLFLEHTDCFVLCTPTILSKGAEFILFLILTI